MKMIMSDNSDLLAYPSEPRLTKNHGGKLFVGSSFFIDGKKLGQYLPCTNICYVQHGTVTGF